MSFPPGGFGPPPAYGPQPAPYGHPQANPYQAAPQPGPYQAPPQAQFPQGPAPAPAPASGPEFVVADKHFGVAIDATGVTFDAGGQLAEFGWHELGTVQFRPSPAGQRLMVAAVLPDGRFFECVVNARKSSVLQQWLAEIGHVVGFYLAGRLPPR
ncbi:hypothetical protein ACFYVL_12870 [Streptomyces sp. NPDC004111]|uniref:hypothetical protein n=1 Tax=Streptomyces sp. NPDC004111 TaxID=3364690 RepID=UPI0036AB91DA